MNGLVLDFIANQVASGLFILDAQGGTRWANQRMLQRTGYTYEDFAGRLPRDVPAGPETDPDTLAHMRAGRRAAPCAAMPTRSG